MNNPSLYAKSNSLQKRDVENILSSRLSSINWSAGDLILDIGCGNGDVTANILLPKLPRDIGRLIGADLSQPMVDHAAARYKHPKLVYTQLDIASDELDLERLIGLIKVGNEDIKCSHGDGLFDKVFSFYCLNWVIDQKLAMNNIFKLLKPNGEGLVFLAASISVFNMYRKMAKKTQWQDYLKDLSRFISPYHDSEDPAQEFDKLLKDAGFQVIECQTEKRSYTFETPTQLRNMLVSVNPFVDRMPEDLKKVFIDEMIEEYHLVTKEDNIKRNENTLKNDQSNLVMNYVIIIAQFKKITAVY